MQACVAVIEHDHPTIECQRTRTFRSSAVFSTPSSSISAVVSNSANLNVPISPYLLFSTPLSSSVSSERQSIQMGTQTGRSSTINHFPLSSTEIRLLQTLHHLIKEIDRSQSPISRTLYFSLNLIELFVYLLIPFVQSYFCKNEKDFLSNDELIDGFRLIWQPLSEYRQPKVSMFNQFIKSDRCSSLTSIEDFSSTDQGRLSSIQVQITKTLDNESSSASLDKHRSNRKLLIDDEEKTSNDCVNEQDPKNFYDSISGLARFSQNSQDIAVDAPIVHMNSICPIIDLSRSSTRREETRPTMPISSSAPSMTPFNGTSRIPTNLNKNRAEQTSLPATLFDVGVLRALFSPSWSTDGYLWSLEYLQQRLIDISDEILSSALQRSTSPSNLLRFKSLSMTGIHRIDDEQNLQNFYLNERRTRKIIEEQYFLVMKTNSGDQQQCFSPKNSMSNFGQRNFEFYSRNRR